MIIIHSRKTHPTNWNAHAAVQLWPASQHVSLRLPIPPTNSHIAKSSRVLTNTFLLQIRQCSLARSLARRPRYIKIAAPVHTPRRPPQLDRDDDQAYHPQHKQNEGAHYYDPWEELPLRY